LIEFDYDSLITFMRCPLRYKFEYVNKIDTEKEGIKRFFSETIHETIKHFYKTLKDEGVKLTQKQLHNFWGNLWLEDVDTEKIIYGNKSEKSKLTKKGYSYLNKFHRYNSSNSGTPIEVGLDYNINYMNKYKLSGNIELIRRTRVKLQIVNFSTSRYVPDEFRQKNDIRFTLNSYAFRQIFEKEEDETLYYHVRTNKKVPVYRGQNDYEKLLTIIDNVYKCIEEDLYYPRISYLCKQCKFHDFCTAWKGQ